MELTEIDIRELTEEQIHEDAEARRQPARPYFWNHDW